MYSCFLQKDKSEEVPVMTEKVRTLAEQYHHEIVELRRRFHRCPELGRQEHETAP